MSTSYPTIDYTDFPNREPFPTVPLPISTTVDATTITTEQLLSGIITHVITTDKSLTLPSAATLISTMKIHGLTTVSSALDFTILTTPGHVSTIVPGTGGTIMGAADITESNIFRIIITDLTTGSENYVVVNMSGGKPEFNLNPLPYTTALNSTALSATNNLRGVIIHNTSTDLTLMLDTAANLLTAFGPTTQIGSFYDFTIQSTPGNVTTVLVNTGGTIIGVNTVDGAGYFRIQFTNVSSGTEAYYLIRLASDPGAVTTVPAVYVTAANPGLLTASDVLRKNVSYVATSSQSVTFPTAAALVAALGGTATPVGTVVELTLITTRGYVITCVAGTNGTLLGGGRVEYAGSFRFIITNSGSGTETYQVVRIDSAEPSMTFSLAPITTAPINKTPIASSDILSSVFTYDANTINTAQMPAASTLLTALVSFRGHSIAVGFSLEFTAIVAPEFWLTLGVLDPSITLIGSNRVAGSATFRIIFTNVTGGTEAYTMIRLDSYNKTTLSTPAAKDITGGITLTVNELNSGIIRVSTGAPDTITLPTATNIYTTSGSFMTTGTVVDFSVINAAGSGGTVTVSSGAGGTNDTISVLTVAVGTSKLFRVRMTSSTTYDLFTLA